MERKIVCKKQSETEHLAALIGKYVFPGCVINLDGNLGAGKTTFTQALALSLGIKEHVSSPTFNILKCYFDGSLPLYHIDAYRLEDSPNTNIGLEEVLEGDGVCVIEWGKFIEELIFEPLNVKINIIDEHTREFIFSSPYAKYEKIFSALGGFENE